MHRIRPRTAVLGGATIGLIAGTAIYGVISSAAPAGVSTGIKAANASMAVAASRSADCAAGQKLEHGVCIVHVVRTVVVPAAGIASSPGSNPSASRTHASESADHEGAGEADQP
jgi:hypothetical protein